jgi:glucuronoarabinoxylan endo-1,4-beta-xylanase
MHHAMVDAQFNAYVWWYIVRSYGPIKAPGTVSKRGWCMAQFSKFIRPGFYRVDATASPMSGVFLSAYKSDTDVVVVVVNTNAASASLNVSINGSSITSYDRFTTSATKSLASDGKVAASNGSLTLSLDAQSVTTLRGSSGSASGAGGSSGSGGARGTGGAAGGAGGTTGSAGSAGSDASTGAGGSSTDGTGGSSQATGGATGNDRHDAGSPGEVSANGGCGCRVADGQPTPTLVALSGVFVALAVARRRRPRARR